MCLELRVAADLRGTLVECDPVDLSAFLEVAPQVKDLRLKAMLADIWEPLAVRALSVAFGSLPRRFTAKDVLSACDDMFRQVSAILSGDEGPEPQALANSHLEVGKVGGSCRFSAC